MNDVIKEPATLLAVPGRNVPRMAEEHLGVGKVCPRCGARANTLGSICPACGRPYDPGGLLERLPFMDDSVAYSNRSASMWFLLALLLAAGWVALLITHPVAGIIITGAAFVLLVAAIGLTNALAARGRR